jgi:hypothetical protein
LLLLSLTALLLVRVSSKRQAATAVARHLFHGHLIDDRLDQPPSGPASKSMSFPLSTRSSPNRCPLLRADRKPPRAAVAVEKRLHADRHLRPWNRPANTTVSTACALNFSPSHEPGATTTGRRSPRRSPLAACPPPWSTFYGELFPAPTPKSGSSPRRPPPRPVSPPSTLPVHQNRPEPPPPRAMAAPPLLRSGAGSPARLGRPEAAQVHITLSQLPFDFF